MIDIAVNDLQKEYQVGQPVLTGLTFQVDTGERVGILGKNGAGKTTLLSILTAQNPATRGTVTVDGEPVNLTPLEFNILQLLIRSPGRIYSSSQIYELVWNENSLVS